jgi:DNA-binding response OmpR family regulator
MAFDRESTMAASRRLLMIDDDVNLVNVFRLVCTAKGYEFHAAHSAAEALRRIPEVDPDLIILDVIMEDFVAGFRVVSELRAGAPDSPLARFASVPIIMLTSVTRKTHVNFADRIGTALLPVDEFIEKPVKPAEILAKIEAILARPRHSDAAEQRTS